MKYYYETNIDEESVCFDAENDEDVLDKLKSLFPEHLPGKCIVYQINPYRTVWLE
jgi:hypothetical protein